MGVVRNGGFFFFNDTATTEIYTLSLHDALPIYHVARKGLAQAVAAAMHLLQRLQALQPDRKSTRLNSSHGYISYAVFCLKKKIRQNGHMSSQWNFTATVAACGWRDAMEIDLLAY